MKLYYLIYLWLWFIFKVIIFTSALIIETALNDQSILSISSTSSAVIATSEPAISSRFRLLYQDLSKNLDFSNKQLDLKKRHLSKRTESLAECKDIFENSKLDEELKICLKSIANETYCRGAYDSVCLCDSKKYYDSTMVHGTYAQCFRGFNYTLQAKYESYYRNLCKNPQRPSSKCTRIPGSQKQILCRTPYKSLNLPKTYEDCLNKALTESLCKDSYTAECLCDSYSYWRAINICKINMNSEDHDKVKKFNKMLCEEPKEIKGCVEENISDSVQEPSTTSIISTSSNEGEKPLSTEESKEKGNSQDSKEKQPDLSSNGKSPDEKTKENKSQESELTKPVEESDSKNSEVSDPKESTEGTGSENSEESNKESIEKTQDKSSGGFKEKEIPAPNGNDVNQTSINNGTTGVPVKNNSDQTLGKIGTIQKTNKAPASNTTNQTPVKNESYTSEKEVDPLPTKNTTEKALLKNITEEASVKTTIDKILDKESEKIPAKNQTISSSTNMMLSSTLSTGSNTLTTIEITTTMMIIQTITNDTPKSRVLITPGTLILLEASSSFVKVGKIIYIIIGSILVTIM